jgi:hyaluronoglucosaminidase
VTAYVVSGGSGVPGVVTPIHTATSTTGQPIPIPLGQSIVITLNGTTACVPDPEDGTVTLIRTATSTAGPPIPVGKIQGPTVITPDSKTAYVANTGDGTVILIRTATSTAGPPITVGIGRLPSPSPDQATGRHGKQTGFRE